MDYQKFLHAAFLLDLDRQTCDEERRDLHETARAQVDAGELDSAAVLFRHLLNLDDKDAEVWHDYGLLLLQQTGYVEGCEALLRSIRLDASVAQRHYDFGAGLGHVESPTAILVQQYVDALEIARTTTDAAYSTGFSLDMVRQGVEQTIEATASIPEAQAEAYLRLGHLSLAQHDLLAAARAYRKALALAPMSTIAAENLATTLKLQGKDRAAALVRGEAYYGAHRFADAIPELQQGLIGGAGTINDYRRLAWSLHYVHRYAEAVEVCRKGIDLFPDANSLYSVWVLSLEQLSQVEAALEVANRAVRLLDDPIFMFHERNLMLPVIYQEESEILRHRARYEAGLKRLAESVHNGSVEELQRLARGMVPNFYLGYQGVNSADLLGRYGQISHELAQTIYPEYCIRRSMPVSVNNRLRIGYISHHLRQHTVARLFLGWLELHNREGFDVYTYHTGQTQDFLSHQIEAASEHYYHLDTDINEIAKQVLDDDLHVLVFLDIGMDHLTTRLANLRLAPVQCAAWGHPVTTGFPTIDYFLSSDLMEPEDADSHYTEILVRLPGISINVAPPYLPNSPKSPGDFELPPEAVLYFTGQSLFKYLPQHDFVFPSIASRVPEAHFVFVASHVPEITKLFSQRLFQAFEQAGLDARKHITFHKPLSPLDYIELMRVCDVFLDSIGWSGGMTTLEAIGCSIPVVTYPGKFMRGRHSYAILRQLGATDTIADSLEDYIEIAVRLGSDPEYRRKISCQIAAGHDRLFNDRSGLDALETFYKQVVGEQLAYLS